MVGSLESETDGLDAICIKELGDPITYAIGGTNPKRIWAYVDHSDKTERFAGSQITDQDIWIEVLKTDVPSPTATDRITLPQTGMVLSPRDWRRNRDGRMWHIYMKRVR